MSATPESMTQITGRITPRLERALLRAAEISTENGHNFLGAEHIALAIVEDEDSVPAQCWRGAMTISQWREALIGVLSGYPTGDAPAEPVTVHTQRAPQA